MYVREFFLDTLKNGYSDVSNIRVYGTLVHHHNSHLLYPFNKEAFYPLKTSARNVHMGCKKWTK
jgi:hypothetical protein